MVKRILLTFLLTAASFVFLANASQAAASAYDKARDNLGKIGAQTGLGEIQKDGQVNIYARLAGYLNVLLGLVGIVASVYIIYAGIKWIKAGGNEQEVTEAKDTIRSAIYGLLVVFASYAIVNFVVLKLIGSISNQ